MTNDGFQCHRDAEGNIWVQPGVVLALADGSIHQVAGPLAAEVAIDGPAGDGFRTFRRFPAHAGSATCVGGNGNNTWIVCAVAGVATGLFQPSEDGSWKCLAFPDWELLWYPDGSMELWDDTDQVAACGTTGSTAGPDGTLTPTAYAETTYNGGVAFASPITAAYEGGGAFPSAAVHVSAGTAQTGVYPATASDAWESEDDSDWTITGDGSGALELSDGTDTVAIRDSGSVTDPSGVYLTTAYGRLTYNSDTDFTLTVARIPVEPIGGVVYITVTEASPGVVDSVSGPFLAATLPANAGSDHHVPIAEVTASGPRQIVSGPVQWGIQGSGGGDPADYATVRAIVIGGL